MSRHPAYALPQGQPRTVILASPATATRLPQSPQSPYGQPRTHLMSSYVPAPASPRSVPLVPLRVPEYVDATHQPQPASLHLSVPQEPQPQEPQSEPEPEPQPQESPLVLAEPAHEIPKGLPDLDRSLIDSLNSTTPCFVLSDPHLADNPVVAASHEFFQTTGYNTAEVVGHNCRFLQGPMTDSEAIRAISKSLRGGEKSANVLLNYKKDGSPYWNYLRIHPLVDSHGKVAKYVAMQVDVTKSQSAQSSLQELEAKQSIPQDQNATTSIAATNVEVEVEVGAEAANGSPSDGALQSTPIRVDFYNIEYTVRIFMPQGTLDGLKSSLRSITSSVSRLFSPSPDPATATATTTGDEATNPATAKPRTKKVLHHVSGTAHPGHVTAIMGPSGSGKTTLLSILGNRVKTGVLSGDVLYNGRPKTKQIKRFVGFVLQDDILFGDLTVRETLTITALLRLPNTMTREQKLQRVEDVITTLGITKCAGSLIGSAFQRGVSGGERKRVNVGNELITDPSVLMLDEPTSGLDSSTAYLLLVTLKRLASQGKTIILSIHQPSSQMFAMLDQLILLADGYVAYQGTAAKTLTYFSQLGYSCPPGFNMADYLMDVLTDQELQTNEASSAGNLPTKVRVESSKKRLTDAYRKNVKPTVVASIEGFIDSQKQNTQTNTGSALGLTGVKSDTAFSVTQAESGTINTATETQIVGQDQSQVQKEETLWPTTLWQQYIVLCSRAFKLKRGQTLKSILFWQYVAMSAVVGAIWFQVGTDEENLRNRIGVIFFLTIYWSFQSLFSALSTFPGERGILLKERASGSYRLLAYYLAKSTAELPFELLWPSFSLLIVYWVAGLNPDPGHFFLFWFCLLLNCLTAQSLGLTISASVTDFQKAIVIAATTMLASMLISGFYAKIDTIPEGIRELRYGTFILYAFNVLLKVDVSGDIKFRCSKDPDFYSSYAACPEAEYIPHEQILDEYQADLTPGQYIGIMFLFTVVMRVVAYKALQYYSKA